MFANLKNRLHALTTDQRFVGILRGSAWALAGQSSSALLGLITSVFIARHYGAEVMGTVAVVTSVLALMTIFTLLGTDTAVLRLLPKHLVRYSATSARKVYQQTALMVTWVALGAGLLLFLGARPLAEHFFSKPDLTFYLALTAPFLLFSSLKQLNTQAIRGLGRIRYYSLMLVLSALINLFLLLLLKFLYFQPTDPLYSLFASLVGGALIGWVILGKCFAARISAADQVHTASYRSILEISLPMLVTYTFFFFIGQSGTMFLGIFQPAEQIGYYDVAMKLSSLVTFILTAINAMVAPRFAELYHAGKMDELFAVAHKAAKLIFWATVPILLFLIILGKPLLGLVFGANFTKAYPALVLLVIGQFVNAASGATGFVIYMTGDEKILRNYTVVTAILNIALSLILIPRFGIAGAALASAVGISVLNGALLIYIWKRHGRITGYLPFLSLRP